MYGDDDAFLGMSRPGRYRPVPPGLADGTPGLGAPSASAPLAQ